MTTRIPIVAGLALLLGPPGPAGPSPSFAVASVRFEQNATDGDVEVVFEVKGGAAGLTKLTVVSPDGRTVIDFTAPNVSTLGIRQFRFESPEPRDFQSLRSAYPEGIYTFAGVTAAGDKLHGESRLDHELPATTSFLRPGADARNVGTQDLEITWRPVMNLAAYIVTIEQPELGLDLTARLPGSVGGFAVPKGLLVPDKEYQLGIGTVSKDGNISFVETAFTTARRD